MKGQNDRIPLIYAHRGASGYEVDNTITAFDLAIEQGADGLESDVYLTTDGIPYLYHDSMIQVEREGEIKEVKPDSIHSDEFEAVVLDENETVPTVEDFFQKYGGEKAHSGKLLKFSFDFQLNTTESVAKLAKKYSCEDQLYMCAKWGTYFKKIRDISTKVHLVGSNSIRPLTFQTFQKDWSKYQKYGIEIFNIKAEDFKPKYIPKLTKAGFKYYIWDLHDEERLRKYLPYKPFGIYSNYPDLALEIRQELFGE